MIGIQFCWPFGKRCLLIKSILNSMSGISPHFIVSFWNMKGKGGNARNGRVIYSFFKFYFVLLYNTVLVLRYINMNLPRVYTWSQSWTPLPPPSTYHLSGNLFLERFMYVCVHVYILHKRITWLVKVWITGKWIITQNKLFLTKDKKDKVKGIPQIHINNV